MGGEASGAHQLPALSCLSQTLAHSARLVNQVDPPGQRHPVALAAQRQHLLGWREGGAGCMRKTSVQGRSAQPSSHCALQQPRGPCSDRHDSTPHTPCPTSSTPRSTACSCARSAAACAGPPKAEAYRRSSRGHSTPSTPWRSTQGGSGAGELVERVRPVQLCLAARLKRDAGTLAGGQAGVEACGLPPSQRCSLRSGGEYQSPAPPPVSRQCGHCPAPPPAFR